MNLFKFIPQKSFLLKIYTQVSKSCGLIMKGTMNQAGMILFHLSGLGHKEKHRSKVIHYPKVCSYTVHKLN
jgi:hypothetical protein